MRDSTERGYTMGELAQAARRRARPALAVCALVAVAGAAVVFAMPNEYRAEATIILEPYRPHPDLVKPAVTTLLEDRLRVAREALLAGPRLERVVREYGLYPKVVRKQGLGAAAAVLRAHLEVKPDGDSAIDLAYRTPDRKNAAEVVHSVAEGFVEANASDRIGQAQRLHDILADELKKVTAELDVQEDKVRAFRLAHDGELPEQLEANLREAERATHELDTEETWLHAVEQQQALLPTQPTSPEVNRLGAMEDELAAQLNHAKALYSADYPDTVRLSRELTGIQEAKATAMAKAQGAREQRAALARARGRAKSAVARLEGEISAARGRAEASARWAAALTVLERDRDLLRQKYQSLSSRKVESEVALALEERSAPLATDVIDPPSEPTEPAAPDRPHLLFVVLALALGLGVGTGVWLESRDLSMRTPAQARAGLDVPLLAVVPGLKGR